MGKIFGEGKYVFFFTEKKKNRGGKGRKCLGKEDVLSENIWFV